MNTWADWLAATDQNQKIDSIVMISAGGPGTLMPALQTQAAHIAVVNANPTQQEALQQAVARDPRVTLLQLAVAAEKGAATFHVLSLAGLSGLFPPRELSQLFPGLRKITEASVPTLKLEEVLRQIGLPAKGCHVLRLDVPANGVEVASQIADLPEDLVLEHVFLRVALTGLYDGGSAPESVLAALEAKGYSLNGHLSSDPDFPEYWLRRDPLKLRCAQLEADLASRDETVSEQQKQLSQKQARIDELARALAEADTNFKGEKARADGLKTELADREQTLDDQKKQLSQKQSRMDELTHALAEAETKFKGEKARADGLETRRAEEQDAATGEQNRLSMALAAAKADAADNAGLRKELQEATASLRRERASIEEMTQSLQDFSAQVKALEGERDAALGAAQTATTQIDALKIQLGQVEKVRDQKQDALGQLEDALTKLRGETADIQAVAQQDVAMAMRLQTLAQEDLRELRTRYQQLQADKAAQDTLLRNVTARLQQATLYLQQLDPAEALPGITGGQTATLAAEPETVADTSAAPEADDAAARPKAKPRRKASTKAKTTAQKPPPKETGTGKVAASPRRNQTGGGKKSRK